MLPLAREAAAPHPGPDVLRARDTGGWSRFEAAAVRGGGSGRRRALRRGQIDARPTELVDRPLAVFAYNSSLAKLKEANGVDAAQESDVKRIVELASFAEKTWTNDGPTDAIRHVLAFYQANRDKDYEAAWKTYAGIGSGYRALPQARREMAGAADRSAQSLNRTQKVALPDSS